MMKIFCQFIHNNYFGSDCILQKVLEERAEQVAKLAKERQERDREERRKYVVPVTLSSHRCHFTMDQRESEAGNLIRYKKHRERTKIRLMSVSLCMKKP